MEEEDNEEEEEEDDEEEQDEMDMHTPDSTRNFDNELYVSADEELNKVS